MNSRHYLSLAGLLLLSACADGIDAKVEEPSAIVLARLTNLPANADVFPMARQFPNTSYYVARTGNTVMWIFRQSGHDACRFIAMVADTGPGTSQVTTKLQDDSKGEERYLCKVVKLVGEESVAATLAGRSADVQTVNSKLKQYIVTDYAAITDAVGKRMEEMAPPSDPNCTEGSERRRESCRIMKRNYEERNRQ